MEKQMPNNDLYIGQHVFVIPFKGHQFHGKIISIKDKNIVIETKDGTRKINMNDIRTIGNI
jgi:ribosome maturation factor RimP